MVAMIRRLGFALLPLLALMLASGGTRAQGDPAEFVAQLGERVVEVLRSTQPDDPQRKATLREVFEEHFAVDTIARSVLARHWRSATPEQRSEYRRLFREFVLKSYAQQFAGYSGETFEVRGTQRLGGDAVSVQARIIRPEKEPISLAFRVEPEEGKLQILDVAVEEVSLLITKRTEFDSVVAREGIDGLLKRLAAQVERLNAA